MHLKSSGDILIHVTGDKNDPKSQSPCDSWACVRCVEALHDYVGAGRLLSCAPAVCVLCRLPELCVCGLFCCLTAMQITTAAEHSQFELLCEGDCDVRDATGWLCQVSLLCACGTSMIGTS